MSNNSNIDIDIVEDLLRKRLVKRGAFYAATGLTRQNYSNFKSQGYIPAKHAKNIAKYLDVDVDYLLKNQEEYRSYNDVVHVNDGYIELQTIHAGAGAEALAVDVINKIAYPKELLPEKILVDENIAVMVVVGNSMEPLYYENDIVFIDLVNGRNFIKSDGTYLVRYGDTVQIKDVMFLGNGDIVLSSRNSDTKINPKKDYGLDWEIIGKPYANLHPKIGSKLKLI